MKREVSPAQLQFGFSRKFRLLQPGFPGCLVFFHPLGGSVFSRHVFNIYHCNGDGNLGVGEVHFFQDLLCLWPLFAQLPGTSLFRVTFGGGTAVIDRIRV